MASTGPDGPSPAYRYFLGNSSFSIFQKMASLLDARGRGEWGRVTQSSAVSSCALVLGDRFDIPYERLREAQPVAGGRKPLVNYFKGSHKLTLKAAMAKLLRDTVPHVDQFMPRSFVLGSSAGTRRRSSGPPARLSRRLSESARSPPGSEAPSPAAPVKSDERAALLAADATRPSQWILKPSAGCGGQGIEVFSSAKALVQRVDQLAKDKSGTPPADSGEDGGSGAGLFAVQEYIANPLLLDGRKFDIRVWALVSPTFDIYTFSQGSCRTASVPYDTSDLSNVYAHLTNHGLQSAAAGFGAFEAGNELWYSALDQVLQRLHHTTFAETVEPQIRKIVVDTLFAAKELLEVGDHERFQCFQLFGFDLLLDARLKLHLVEINGSPGSADRWLEELVHGMLDVVVDPVFPVTSDEAKAQVREVATRSTERTAVDGEPAGKWNRVWSASTDPPPFSLQSCSATLCDDPSGDVVILVGSRRGRAGAGDGES